MLTNTTLMGAYRGAGRPEANYFMERLIERAADEMGIDRIDAAQEEFREDRRRCRTWPSSGLQYDSGDFPGVMGNALKVADYAGFAKRKKESRKHGKLRGIAVGAYLEVTAPPGEELGKIVFDKDGGVTLITGTLDYGQGHATPFSQVLSDAARRAVREDPLVQGDSDIVHTGNGTGGSRSITASGQAIVEASALVIEKGKQAAAHVLEAAEATSSSPAAVSPSPAPTAASTSWTWRSGCRKARCRDGVPVVARRRSRHQGDAVDLPERLSCRRGRDRSRHRRRSRS